MTNVIDFTALRMKEKVTIESIMDDANNFLLGEWRQMQKNGMLEAYFVSSLSNVIGEAANYTTDLNAIASVEKNLSLEPTIALSRNMWTVQYALDDFVITALPFVSEAYARCYGVLFYLYVKNKALKAGLIS